ncbi:MAG: tRNA uracil 4-sulfurtransferase ThiI [Nanoarchaeota archaeon]
MNKVLIKYSEIALKGKNRGEYEKKLLKNIKISSKKHKLNLHSAKFEKQTIICEYDNSNAEITYCLKKIFGIKIFSFVCEIPKSIESILDKAEEIIKEFKDSNINQIAFKTKRTDKKFELQSPQINAKMGEIAQKYDIKTNYKNPQETIFVEIGFRKAFIHTKRIKGPGGLPVGTSRRVLVLLSGGIDSPVASYEIMKRGLTCDFLHIHTYQKNDFVLNTKISQLVEKLNQYQFVSNLYLLPYSYYEFQTINKIPPRYEMIFFKHFIFKIAQKLAIEKGYDAIISGDNLCQVASQTIENIKATSLNINIPIFRPLLTADKEDIIKKAILIETYNMSLKKYKDCCSLVAKNPLTQTNLEKFEKLVNDKNIDKLVDDNYLLIERFKLY